MFFQQHLPFAVVGSREEVVINGEKFRARQYPWGTVLGKLIIYAFSTFLDILINIFFKNMENMGRHIKVWMAYW